MSDSNRVYIFDTTLRDGEQSPGASMNTMEKIEIAKTLEALGVDIIEVGFPASSKEEVNTISEVAKTIKNSVLTGFARHSHADIDACVSTLKIASQFRIHIFIATSPIHMKHKLRKTPEEILAMIKEHVTYARRFTDDVQWCAEDATRSDFSFLCKAVEVAISSGAKTINIADTVGYSTPSEYGSLIQAMRNKIPNIHKVTLSTHCHNDLGLAVANSLAGIQAGARQVECTINGIGERAGNAALEEVVMAIKVRGDIYLYQTEIKTSLLKKTSTLVSKITQFPVQYNKAIVGKNAFRHEAGIHQDGVLKERLTYEIISPETVGAQEPLLVLGKHSGHSGLKNKLEQLGFSNIPDELLSELLNEFKTLAHRKKNITDKDLLRLMSDSGYI